MAFLGLNFKVSKRKTTTEPHLSCSMQRAKECLKKLMLKKGKLSKSGGNGHFKKAKRPP